MIEESKSGYVLGDHIPPLTGPKADKEAKRIRAQIQKKKIPRDRLAAIAAYANTYVKEHSENGRAFLMIDPGLVWAYAMQARVIAEVLTHG